jgi:mono/diheme cytochrome c family protein
VHKAVRWTFRILGGVVALLVILAGAVYALSSSKLRRAVEVPAHALTVKPDSASATLVAQGQYLASARGCVSCHGSGLGGKVLVDDAAFATLYAANLTSSGAPRTDEQWERAVRHGLRPDGSRLIIMPAEAFNRFTDEELAAIVSYARSLPPATQPTPGPRVGPVARALLTAGKFPLPADVIDHAKPHEPRVAVEQSAVYGAHVATMCQACHGEGFSGGPFALGPPDGRPPRNITPDMETGIGKWSEEDFVRALRTGRRPDGTAIDSTSMPIDVTRVMNDTELRSLYAFLRTVPAKPYGNH